MKTYFGRRFLTSAVALGVAAFVAGATPARGGGGYLSSSMDEPSNEQSIREKVNLNTASVDELAKVPGIGYDRAKAIVDYRDSNGPLYWVDQVLNVKGIGQDDLNAFRERVTVW